MGLEREYYAELYRVERFLLELGVGFTFVARRKRISVGADDFYLDLLFYHRHLKRLVAVELKLEKFQPAHSWRVNVQRGGCCRARGGRKANETHRYQ